jgi:hypothetical protein
MVKTGRQITRKKKEKKTNPALLLSVMQRRNVDVDKLSCNQPQNFKVIDISLFLQIEMFLQSCLSSNYTLLH